MGVKMVTMEGEILEIGGAHLDAAGLDLLGLFVGRKASLVLLPKRPCGFCVNRRRAPRIGGL